MFADPQSVTIGTAQTLARTGTGPNQGRFQKDDGTIVLSVVHQNLKARNRRTFRIDHSKVAADPLVTAQNLRYSGSMYIVTDFPVVGYSIAEQIQVVTGVFTNLTASTNANLTRFLGGES
jgi:hypothetical protein